MNFVFRFRPGHKSGKAPREKGPVVISLHHGLGDVAMALPLLVSVDASLPELCRIILLVKSAAEAQLLSCQQWHHRVSIRSLRWSGSWNPFFVAISALKLRTSKPQIYLAPHAADSLTAALFSRIVGAPISVGPEGRHAKTGYSASVRRIPGERKAEYYKRFATPAFGCVRQEKGKLAIDDAKMSKALNLFSQCPGDSRLVICPMSSGVETHKRWPETRYSELIRYLLIVDDAIRIVLLGSPGERERLNAICRECNSNRVKMVAQGDIEQAMAHIAVADCFLSGCTGPLHLADLLHVPIVALYGPTDPAVTGPSGPAARILRAGLECSPCYRPGYEKGCGAPHCMAEIGMLTVAREVMNTLSKATQRIDQGKIV